MAKKPAAKAKSKNVKPVAAKASVASGSAMPVPAKVGSAAAQVAAIKVADKVEDTVAVGGAAGFSAPASSAGPIVKPLRMPVEVSAPALASPAWFQRWLGGGKTVVSGDSGMREHMAAVKAGVMHELETLSAEKGMPVKASPFSNIVLPQVRKKRQAWIWPAVALGALVFAGGMLLVAGRPAEPAVVLARALAAAQEHDVATLARDVDVDTVAVGIVNQVFSAPRLDVKNLPQALREGLGGDGLARLNASVKPGLAETLKDDVLAAIRTGGLQELDERSPLLRLWQRLGGDDLKFGQPRIAMRDEAMVVAELPLHRRDLNITLPLQVVMAKGEGGHWRVVDVPNFSAVLDSFASARPVHIAEEAAANRVEPARPLAPAEMRIDVSGVRKAKGSDRLLLLTMRVVNKGEAALRDVQLQVAFGDASGRPMKTALVTLGGELAPGQAREQTWALPIDVNRTAERYVLDLPLSALTVKVAPAGAGEKRVEREVPARNVVVL